MSDFSLALKPYTYGDTGMIGRYPDNPGDNLHLETAQAVCLAERLKDPIALPLATMAVIFAHNCMVGGFAGLYSRSPGDAGQMSWDEYFGLLRSEWSTEHNSLAAATWAYGFSHFFCYNVPKPGTLSYTSFFARNLMFVPFVAACLRDKNRAPGLFLQTLWCFGLWLSVYTLPAWKNDPSLWVNLKGIAADFMRLIKIGFKDRTDTSGKLLCDVQLDPMRGYFLTKRAIGNWCGKMNVMYPGGRKEAYTIYFPDGHPDGAFQEGAWT